MLQNICWQEWKDRKTSFKIKRWNFWVRRQQNSENTCSNLAEVLTHKELQQKQEGKGEVGDVTAMPLSRQIYFQTSTSYAN